jgi:hypothetical protein
MTERPQDDAPRMHAAAAIESRPLMKSVIVAMGHPRFAKLRTA